jgi:predicted nucleic acid-binding protein
MKVLIDTKHCPGRSIGPLAHANASVAVWAPIETGSAQGLLPAHAVTTVHYLICRELSVAKARRTIAAMLRVFDITAVDEPVIQLALELPLSDLEDAVTTAAAQFAGCESIVTRDPKGFRGCGIRSIMPETAVPLPRDA